MILLIAGGIGALIDITLHILQLWPKLVPTQALVQGLTIAAGLLLVLSCITAPNPGALIMGVGLIAMTLFSMVTHKDLG